MWTDAFDRLRQAVLDGAPVAEELAAGRELIALVGGPWAGRWHWADQFADTQQAARRYPVEHPAGQLAGYHPTGKATEHCVPHPDPREAEDGVTGWVFTWQPQRAASGWEHALTAALPTAPAARPEIPQQRRRRQEIATDREALHLHITTGSERAA